MKKLSILLIASIFLSSFQSLNYLDYEYIEIVNLESKPIIKGFLNGKKAFFLLDTGSDLSFLNSESETDYDFKINRNTQSHIQFAGMGGRIYGVRKVDMAKLRLGTQLIYARYMSYDMQNIVDAFEKRTGKKICGIIGSDIMRNYGFKIDYEKRQVGIALKGSYYTKK